MLDTRYAFISAYLKGEEARVMTSEHVARMPTTPSIQEVLATIRETDIGDYLQGVPIRTFADLDKCLWRYLQEYIASIEAFRFLPSDIFKVLRVYMVKYDVHNVKAALHGIVTGKKANMIPLGVIHHCRLLDELANAQDIDGITELLTKCQLADYASVLKQYEIDEGLKARFVVEARLDQQYYKSLLSMTKDVKEGFVLAKAFGLSIDLTNLQIVSRAIIEDIRLEVADCIITSGYLLSAEAVRELLTLKLSEVAGRLGNTLYRGIAEEISSSYDRIQSITSVDEIIDKYKFRLVKEILSPRVLSPPVIAWHLIVKELEIRNLRLILKAMFDNIPLEKVGQYLVLSS